MTVTADLDPQAEAAIPEPAEQRIVLYGIEWDQYEQIADALNGRHVRLTYDRGALEFMTISPKHGWIARLFAQFLVILSEETGMARRSCGDITMKRAELERAIEPDECFYLLNESAVRGKDEIDFDADPPPDLGVEVDISSSSRRRMPVYAALKVPEVWRFSRERLTIHQLTPDGTYRVAECSRYFAFVTPAILTEFVARRSTLDENSLMKSFREWVREQNRPK